MQPQLLHCSRRTCRHFPSQQMGTVCFQTTGLLPERFSAANVTAACIYCRRMRQPLLQAGNKMSGHIYPKIKYSGNKTNHVWENFGLRDAVSDLEIWSSGRQLISYWTVLVFFIAKWWPMQREAMTSQLDLHFTPLFERIVSVLCQFLHSFRPQAQRPRWIRNRASGWPQQLLNLGPDRSICNCKGVR